MIRIVIILLLLGAAVYGCQPPTGDPVVEVLPTTTPTTAVTPSATPLAQRVQFPLGSYGVTLGGNKAGKYLLWARAGQTLSLKYTAGVCKSELLGPDGGELLAGKLTTKLLQDGDQVLTVYCDGNFSFGVDIR